MLELVRSHWANVLTATPETVPVAACCQQPADVDDILLAPINAEELLTSVKACPLRKSPGEDVYQAAWKLEDLVEDRRRRHAGAESCRPEPHQGRHGDGAED